VQFISQVLHSHLNIAVCIDDKLNAIICKLSCILSSFIGSNAFSTSNRPRLSRVVCASERAKEEKRGK
jgi:hypothetical protein